MRTTATCASKAVVLLCPRRRQRARVLSQPTLRNRSGINNLGNKMNDLSLLTKHFALVRVLIDVHAITQDEALYHKSNPLLTRILGPHSLPLPPKCSYFITVAAIPPTYLEAAAIANRFRFQNPGCNQLHT